MLGIKNLESTFLVMMFSFAFLHKVFFHAFVCFAPVAYFFNLQTFQYLGLFYKFKAFPCTGLFLKLTFSLFNMINRP